MSGWTVIVPIKPAAERKSRLDPHLTPAARIAVTETMLAHVVATLAQSAAIAGVMVLARERPSGWSGGWSRDCGSGLNEEVGAIAATIGRRLVALHADLPALTGADIDALVSAAAGGSAIAPDRHLRGTMRSRWVRPARCTSHFSRTLFAVIASPCRMHVFATRPSLALDIDEEDDFAEAVRSGVLGPLERKRR